MTLRYDSRTHEALIASGPTLQPVNAKGTDATDTLGQDRYMYAIQFEGGADLQQVRFKADSWLNREIFTPPLGELGLVDGLRTYQLPYMEFIVAPDILRSAAAQDSGGPQTVTFRPLFLTVPPGEALPAMLTPMVAKNHSIAFAGVANVGQFPEDASASEILLKQNVGETWRLTQAAINGSGDPIGRFDYPNDGGNGPIIPGLNDVYNRRPWMDIPPLHMLNSGDTIELFVADAAASAFDGFLTMIKAEGSVPTRFNFLGWP